MALKIDIHNVGEVLVLELSGRLVLGEETSLLRASIDELLTQGKTMLVLNVKNLTYIDSSGVGTLVAAFNSARLRGASLKISAPRPRFREIFQLARPYTAFEIFPNTQLAIQSFAWYHCAKHGPYVGPPPCPKCS